jgi:hypothetical protein
MKINQKTAWMGLAGLVMGVTLLAQNAPERPGRPGEGGPPRARMVMPLMAALDLNGDGTLDKDEIAKASESLLKLDKNGDGKLTPDELRPDPADWQGRGQGGRPGDGGAPRQRPQRP